MSAPADWRALWGHADRLIRVGRDSEAVTVLQDALRLAPDEGHIHCQLAWALLRLGRAEESLAAAGRAAALRPEDEWAQRLRSLALGMLDRDREALEAARTAQRLAPAKFDVLYTLVDALMAVGSLEEAMAVAGQMVALAPDEGDAYERLGRVALKARDWKGAEAHFRKALELDAGQARYLAGLAAALREQDRRDDALEVLHAAARLAPGSFSVRQELEAFAEGHLDVKLNALVQMVLFGGLFLFGCVTTVADARAGWSGGQTIWALCTLANGAIAYLFTREAARTLPRQVRRFYLDLWRSRLRRLWRRA